MDNYAIADQLSLLAQLMDIHGENAFRSKSYASAAFAVEKLDEPLASLTEARILAVKGIGESVGRKVVELLSTGEIAQLKEYIGRTPEGVIGMMNIKGLGPKKIHTIWKELGIDSIEGLRRACQEGRIAATKGFGAKTQQKILEALQFQEESTGKYLYAQAEPFEAAFRARLQERFPDHRLQTTGAFRRQLDVIAELEFVTTIPADELKKELAEHFALEEEGSQELAFRAEGGMRVVFHLATEKGFAQSLLRSSCGAGFLQAWKELPQADADADTEEELFRKCGLPYIPPFRREEAAILQRGDQDLSEVIQTADIKGLIHAHSTWSDGAYPLEEMAQELIRLGFEYLVISDHSKAAFYANGLNEERIRAQHHEIDALNKKLHPFRIFKSIECDILSEGELDFDNEVLASFDLVIVSVHSNLDMDEDKAMKRLLGAISNPYTTILGHMTGRRLLRRKGYPVNHKAIIEACIRNNVVIEINANPQRLDMEWPWVEYALEQGLMLSVNPDAHSIEEFANIRYGVLAGQKGGLTPARNLSSFSLREFEQYLANRKKSKGLH